MVAVIDRIVVDHVRMIRCGRRGAIPECPVTAAVAVGTAVIVAVLEYPVEIVILIDRESSGNRVPVVCRTGMMTGLDETPHIRTFVVFQKSISVVGTRSVVAVQIVEVSADSVENLIR